MSQALEYLYYMFNKFTVFVFDTMEIQQGVTVGWVIISIILFSMLIRSILNVPRGMGSFDKFREHTWRVDTSKGTQYVSKKRL